MDKAVAIIQARMSSTRLPGKVLMDLSGKPIIWHIYKRAERCKNVGKVIVATSTEQSDDKLAEFCVENNLHVYRGSLNNVLDRFIQVLKAENYKYFVRITGDCPLIHPNLIDAQIEALNIFDGDIVWAPTFGTLYEGQGVMSKRLIYDVVMHSNDPRDKEHVGSNYIVNNPDRIRIVDFAIPKRLIYHNIRITVDEQKDYELISSVYNNLWDGKSIIKLSEVVNLLKKNSTLLNINKEVVHKDFNIEVKDRKKKWEKVPKVGIYEYNDIAFSNK